MRASLLFPAALAIVIAGCQSTDSTSVSTDIDATLNEISSNGIASYTAAAGATAVPGMNAAFAVPATSSASCPYDAATKFFVCTPVSGTGMTMTRSFQLLDASGTPLSAPDPTALASVRSVMDLQGTRTSGTGTSTITMDMVRHEDATMSGVRTTSRVLNATSTQRLTMTASGLTFTSNDTATTANLQLPSSSTQKYPLGGSITTHRTVATSGTGLPSTTQQTVEVISFDGSSIMTIAITHSGTVTTCKVDLSKPSVAPVCS